MGRKGLREGKEGGGVGRVRMVSRVERKCETTLLLKSGKMEGEKD